MMKYGLCYYYGQNHCYTTTTPHHAQHHKETRLIKESTGTNCRSLGAEPRLDKSTGAVLIDRYIVKYRIKKGKMDGELEDITSWIKRATSGKLSLSN